MDYIKILTKAFYLCIYFGLHTFPEAIDLSFILSTMLVYIVLFSDTI